MKINRGWVIFLFISFLCVPFSESFADHTTVQVIIRHAISVKAERVFGQEAERGLSGREELAPNNGMLFDMNEAYKEWTSEERKKATNPIWMLNMKFPIDIIWIANGEVVHVVEDAPIPHKDYVPYYGLVGRCDYVLEVNRGFISSHGIKIGDKVEIKE